METGSESHAGEYLAKTILETIEGIGPYKVAGLITDNASNTKKLWEIVEKQHPHIATYGCLTHALNLIFTDFNKVTSFLNTVINCSTVVKTIKNSVTLSALFKEQQGPDEKYTLKIPVKTR